MNPRSNFAGCAIRRQPMVKVKICGITRLEDALDAARLGADTLGFVFARSPRRVTPDLARGIVRSLPPFVTTVGVFVNEEIGIVREMRDFCGLDYVQLHGEETEAYAAELGTRVIKAIGVGAADHVNTDSHPSALLLLDSAGPKVRGGAGRTFDWSLAVGPARTRPIVLAGGLTPENVAEAVRTARPYAVDVSSGVESEPGKKDSTKLALFIRRAKSVGEPARAMWVNR
jgi:phosphoribosylanthranilate isomerase